MKIGTDIINIERMEKSIAKFGDKFKARFLVQEEISRAKKISELDLISNLCCAVLERVRCGISTELNFHDMIIKKDAKGAPHLTLSKTAQQRFDIKSSSLSISHDSQFAIAVVIIDI